MTMCFKKKCVSSDVETTLRRTWIAALSYVLAIASWDQAVPPSLSFLVGILGTSFSLTLPMFCFGIGAAIPVVFYVVLACLMLGTILLAAATVNSALMTVVFSIMMIALTGMYFGPDFDKTLSLVNKFMFVPGMIALNLRPLVEDGFTINAPFGILPVSLEGVLSMICVREGHGADCWENATDDMFSAGPYAIYIPPESSDMFGGQTAYVSLLPDGSGLRIYIPGGMWVVKGFWTWKGVDNSLAMNRNILLVVCWASLCYAVGVLTPPWRTVRDKLSRTVVTAALQTMATAPAPSALTHGISSPQSAAEAVEREDAGTDTHDTTSPQSAAVEEEGEEAGTDTQDATSPQSASAVEGEVEDAGIDANNEASHADSNKDAVQAVRSKLVALGNIVEGGSRANLTAFEPRLCRAPFEYSVPPLKNLLIETENLIITFFVQSNEEILLAHQRGKEGTEEEGADEIDGIGGSDALEIRSNFVASQALLKTAAEALTDMDATALKGMKEGISFEDLVSQVDYSPSRFLLFQSSKVRLAVLDWIQVLREPAKTQTKDIPKNLYKTYIPWVWSPFSLFRRLPRVLVVPCNPRNWSCTNPHVKGCVNFLWAFKLAVGYIALFVMTLYWDRYRDYAIEADPGTKPQDLYSGWHLAAYAFAYRPTAEGTVKKGMQRILGTCVGGFLAWLGIIVCSGSYAEEAQVNSIALFFWLTLTFACLAYISTKQDDSLFGIYPVVTQVLITLEFHAGKETRDNLVTNRVVATISGVLMAIVIAFVPPILIGRVSQSVHSYYDALEEAWTAILEHAARKNDNDVEDEEFSRSWRDRTALRRKLSLFLIKDQGLTRLPIFPLDPTYELIVGDMAITGSIMWHFVELLEIVPISAQDKTLIKEFSVPHGRNLSIEDPSVYISTAKVIRKRLLIHGQDLTGL